MLQSLAAMKRGSLIGMCICAVLATAAVTAHGQGHGRGGKTRVGRSGPAAHARPKPPPSRLRARTPGPFHDMTASQLDHGLRRAGLELRFRTVVTPDTHRRVAPEAAETLIRMAPGGASQREGRAFYLVTPGRLLEQAFSMMAAKERDIMLPVFARPAPSGKGMIYLFEMPKPVARVPSSQGRGLRLTNQLEITIHNDVVVDARARPPLLEPTL